MSFKLAEAYVELKAQGFDVVETGLYNIKGKMVELKSPADRLNTALGVLAGTAIAGGISRLVSGLASTGIGMLKLVADSRAAQASFETMTGSAGTAARMIANLRTLAAHSPLEFTGLRSNAKTLLQFGVNAGRIMPTLRMLGDVSGGNAQRMQSLTLAFGQISAGGKLTGQDLLQLINAGFNPLQEISARTGESMGSLRAKMEAGAISADMVSESFRRATSAGGQFFENMEKQSKELGGIWSNLNDDMTMIATSIGEAIVTAFDITGTLTTTESVVSSIAKVMKDWEGTLAKAIRGITVFATTWGTVTAAVWLYSQANRAATITSMVLQAVTDPAAILKIGVGLTAAYIAVSQMDEGLNKAGISAKNLASGMAAVASETQKAGAAVKDAATDLGGFKTKLEAAEFYGDKNTVELEKAKMKQAAKEAPHDPLIGKEGELNLVATKRLIGELIETKKEFDKRYGKKPDDPFSQKIQARNFGELGDKAGVSDLNQLSKKAQKIKELREQIAELNKGVPADDQTPDMVKVRHKLSRELADAIGMKSDSDSTQDEERKIRLGERGAKRKKFEEGGATKEMLAVFDENQDRLSSTKAKGYFKEISQEIQAIGSTAPAVEKELAKLKKEGFSDEHLAKARQLLEVRDKLQAKEKSKGIIAQLSDDLDKATKKTDDIQSKIRELAKGGMSAEDLKTSAELMLQTEKAGKKQETSFVGFGDLNKTMQSAVGGADIPVKQLTVLERIHEALTTAGRDADGNLLPKSPGGNPLDGLLGQSGPGGGKENPLAGLGLGGAMGGPGSAIAGLGANASGMFGQKDTQVLTALEAGGRKLDELILHVENMVKSIDGFSGRMVATMV